ncbi:LuxR family transcriptional regulator [Carboxydocella sp. ULO1]|uniref:LuxR family transcriptional regulator n=1 Tax=Carboxydocella sp. ULO1 TaxID=1926599 RepID=UPI0009ABC9E3|nr:LuxR C-terminal-related transcriptional regulator [Carboxydocella sp. ULO1]GAW27886.1 LuxR family transcriptional regulator [Carboxydocella sp. ULO1]
MNKNGWKGRYSQFISELKPPDLVDFLHEFGVTEDELKNFDIECAKFGLTPNVNYPRHILPLADVVKLKRTQRDYLKAALPVLKEVYRILPAGFVCFLTDARGINLYTIARNRKEYLGKGLRQGTDFRLYSAGTNAIALSLNLKRTVILLGPQHYLKDVFGNIWCAAGLIFLPNGEVLWAFDVSAPNENDLRLAVMVVSLICNRLQQVVAKVWYEKERNNMLSLLAQKLAQGSLSSREIEIIPLLTSEQSYAEIARKLHLSQGTINTYISRIYQKLEVSGRMELTIKLLRELEKSRSTLDLFQQYQQKAVVLATDDS